MYICLSNQRCFVATPLRSPDDCNVAILFLHGAGVDHTIWQPIFSSIVSKECSVLVPDLPGHGQTAGPPLTSIEDMALWVRDLLEELQIKHVIVIGHSMGSLIAMEMAHRWPYLIGDIVLAGSALRAPVHPDLLKYAKEQDPKAKDLIVKWGIGYKTEDPEALEKIEATRKLVHKILDSNPPDCLYVDLSACNNYDQGGKIASKLKTRMLVVSGDTDKMIPLPASQELFDVLNPKKRHFCTLKESGHMMMVENPHQFVDNLGVFLKKYIQ